MALRGLRFIRVSRLRVLGTSLWHTHTHTCALVDPVLVFFVYHGTFRAR